MPPRPRTTTARGYGAKHQQLRADYQRRMNQGEHFNCWRCGNPINPNHWQLGHDDNDRTKYRGPEHPKCNEGEGGRRGAAVTNARHSMTIREW